MLARLREQPLDIVVGTATSKAEAWGILPQPCSPQQIGQKISHAICHATSPTP